MNHRRCMVVLALLIAVICFSSGIAYAEGELEINIDALNEDREIYSSMTDIYGLPLFETDEIKFLEQREADEQEKKANMARSCFQPGSTAKMDDSAVILQKSKELNLFSASEKEFTKFKETATKDDVLPIWIYIAAIAGVGAATFGICRHYFKRKSQRMDENATDVKYTI